MLKPIINPSDEANGFTTFLTTLCFTNEIYVDLSISYSLKDIIFKIDVPFEVKNPAGNFDTVRKKFCTGILAYKIKILILAFHRPDFIRFSQGYHLQKY
jgi:hypothetical protein